MIRGIVPVIRTLGSSTSFSSGQRAQRLTADQLAFQAEQQRLLILNKTFDVDGDDFQEGAFQ